MGKKLTRRQVLEKGGLAALGAALASMSGIERLAYAATAATPRARPWATDCGGLVPQVNRCGERPDHEWYGCTLPYGAGGCDSEKVNCGAAFVAHPCQAGDTVFCNSDDHELGKFRCYYGPDHQPYACTNRAFHCNTEGSGGGFICGDGTNPPNPPNYHFRCDPETTGLFDCGGNFAGCSPHYSYHC